MYWWLTLLSFYTLVEMSEDIMMAFAPEMPHDEEVLALYNAIQSELSARKH